MQTALGRHLRIELAQRTGCRISGICKGLFARFELTAVECFEVVAVHDDFAAHFKHLGDAFGIEAQRNRANRADIGRHVFADGAVAAGRGRNEHALFIAQIRRKPVKLEFAVVHDRLVRFLETEVAANAFIECGGPGSAEVRFRVNREHRQRMPDLAKTRLDGPAHAKRRRSGRLQSRVPTLELDEFVEEPVVLAVGHARRIEHVVLVAVALKECLQFAHARGRAIARKGFGGLSAEKIVVVKKTGHGGGLLFDRFLLAHTSKAAVSAAACGKRFRCKDCRGTSSVGGGAQRSRPIYASHAQKRQLRKEKKA